MVTKNNCRCDACGCTFVPEPKTQRENEIEYSFFNCGKTYIVSVIDAKLRRGIRKDRTLAEKLNGRASRRAASDVYLGGIAIACRL